MSYRRRSLTLPKILLSFAVAVAGSLATALLLEGSAPSSEAEAFGGGLLIPLCVGAVLLLAMLLLARLGAARGGRGHFYTQVEGLSTLTFPPESRNHRRGR